MNANQLYSFRSALNQNYRAVSEFINPFKFNISFLYPSRKRQKTFGFLTFSGGIEIEHCAKMG